MINIIISNTRVNHDGSAYIKTGNVGDLSSYYILKHFTNQQVNPINRNSPKQSDGLVMVGSTLRLFFKLLPKGTVIGTGSICDTLNPPRGDYNFLGVRGYLTSELLPGHPPVIGDLGLLLPEAFPRANRTYPAISGQQKIGYIIHAVDQEQFFSMYPHLKANHINNYLSPEEFVKQLSQYKRVISSSLHGLIFAHAYGIPCAGIKITNKIMGGEFKYRDYYSSLNHDYAGRHLIGDDEDWDSILNTWNPSQDTIRDLQTHQIKVLKNYLHLL